MTTETSNGLKGPRQCTLQQILGFAHAYVRTGLNGPSALDCMMVN